MTKLQEAIQDLEDKLLQGTHMQIVLTFTTGVDGEPVIDYIVVDKLSNHLASNLDMQSVEDALIDIAKNLSRDKTS